MRFSGWHLQVITLIGQLLHHLPDICLGQLAVFMQVQLHHLLKPAQYPHQAIRQTGKTISGLNVEIVIQLLETLVDYALHRVVNWTDAV